ncbi:cellulase family glycosylhydrolase [Streptomyces rochei]|uniref:cellulase family glycosylhydrolase n=1 Tax=Streptomyces rochei TaxID=1928 RepID=UPI003680B323
MRKPGSTLITTAGMAFAAVLGLLLSLAGPSTGKAEAADGGIHVSDGRVVEGNGNAFVMRGVNHAYTWYPEQTSSIADIAAKGANTVRVVLGSGGRWTKTNASQVSTLIEQCKANKVICVLEVHDTTGYGEDGAATSLDQAADYWISVKSALEGQEDYVVVNIGNEPFGNTNYTAWTDATKAAITKLRGAGIDHALMVDAPNWGQDWSGTMRSNAASVFASDPDRNTIFSIHMYGVYDTAAEVQDYLNAFVGNGLPIVVGEFGDQHSDGNPDEDAIMATAQSLGVGYIGWSWSGNGSGVEYLDMVNGFDPNSLTGWGDRFFNGSNGITATSKTATVYGGGDDGGGDDGSTGGTAPNGYPYCVNGSASDPDGDGWGWENSRSCVVPGGLAPNGYSYCANGSASDPDGDGWGWENSRSCVVRGGAADR